MRLFVEDRGGNVYLESEPESACFAIANFGTKEVTYSVGAKCRGALDLHKPNAL